MFGNKGFQSVRPACYDIRTRDVETHTVDYLVHELKFAQRAIFFEGSKFVLKIRHTTKVGN